MVGQTTFSPYNECSEVFIGGGYAGVYSFYRRIMDDPTRGPKACLFEQSWRIGGRTYSVKINHTEFVQDIGAYRFSPDMHLPGDLIMKDLKLPTECYEESCPSAKEDFPPPFLFNYSAPLRRIVNPETNLPSGYSTAIFKMLDIAQDFGGKVFKQTSLTKLSISKEKMIFLELHDSVGDKVVHIESPDLVVLNLPRNKLFDVQGVEESLRPAVVDTLKCIVFDMPSDLFSADLTKELDGNQKTTLAKAYLYYKDAWWHTRLNKTYGAWPPSNDFPAKLTKEGVRFNVRFHDGPVVCSENRTLCHGLLETYYSISNETFYSSLPPSPEEPLGSIWNTDGPDAVKILTQAHAGLLDLLGPLLKQKKIDPSSLLMPLGLVVGVWQRPNTDTPLGKGYTAPTKVYYEPSISGPPDKACGVPGLTDDSYREIAIQPWGRELPIFLVNNDWVCANVRSFWGDWAEESLLMAERAMLLLGMNKPSWLDNTYYNEKIVSKVTGPKAVFSAKGDKSIIRDTSIDLKWIISGIVVVALCLYTFVIHRRRTKTKDYSAIP